MGTKNRVISKTKSEVLKVCGQEVNQEDFNRGLKDGLESSVDRVTMVLEETNKPNSKLVIKKYVTKKNGKKKTFKNGFSKYALKTYFKEYTSVTVNAKDLSFCIYYINNNSKAPYVRRDIITHSIIDIVSGLDTNEYDEKTNHGIREIIEVFIDLITPEQEKGVGDNFDKSYVMSSTNRLNYRLSKNLFYRYGVSVTINSPLNIIQYATIFRIDKKSYKGKSIYEYISKTKSIDNIGLVKRVLDHATKDSSSYTINLDALSIYSALGYEFSDIIREESCLCVYDSTKKGLSFSSINKFYNKYVKSRYLRFIGEHKTALKHLNFNDLLNVLNKLLVLEDVYGLKFKTDFNVNIIDLIDKVKDTLDATTRNTGLIHPNKELNTWLTKKLGRKLIIDNDVNRLIREGTSMGCDDIFDLSRVDQSSYITIRSKGGKKFMDLSITPDYCYQEYALPKKNNTMVDLIDTEKKLGKKIYKGDFGLNVIAIYSKKQFIKTLSEDFSKKEYEIFQESIVY